MASFGMILISEVADAPVIMGISKPVDLKSTKRGGDTREQASLSLAYGHILAGYLWAVVSQRETTVFFNWGSCDCSIPAYRFLKVGNKAFPSFGYKCLKVFDIQGF